VQSGFNARFIDNALSRSFTSARQDNIIDFAISNQQDTVPTVNTRGVTNTDLGNDFFPSSRPTPDIINTPVPRGGLPPPIIGFPTPLPFLPLGGGVGRSSTKRGAFGFDLSAYTPAISAVEFGIKGSAKSKKQLRFGGLELRGL
jgi:hypothetical protein